MRKKEWKKKCLEAESEIEFLEEQLRVLVKIEKKYAVATRLLRKHNLLDEFKEAKKDFEEEQKNIAKQNAERRRNIENNTDG